MYDLLSDETALRRIGIPDFAIDSITSAREAAEARCRALVIEETAKKYWWAIGGMFFGIGATMFGNWMKGRR